MNDSKDISVVKNVIISLTKQGYLRRISLEEVRVHRRGGKGVQGSKLVEGDSPKLFLSCSEDDDLLFFSNLGKVYKLNAGDLDLSYGKKSKGKHIKKFLVKLEDYESIVSIISLSKEDYKKEGLFLLFATKRGLFKRVSINDFKKIDVDGKKAIKLNNLDGLKSVSLSKEDSDILLTSSNSKSTRFKASDVKSTSRTSKGSLGIFIDGDKNEFLVSSSSTYDGRLVFSVSENGKGKLTDINDFRLVSRGKKKGVIAQKLSDEKLVACTLVKLEDEILLMTSRNRINRFKVSDIRVQGRNTSGVRLFNLDHESNEKIIAFSKSNFSTFPLP